MANGGSIEAWWNMYPFHKTKEIREDLLSKYRVGTLHEDDRVDEKSLPDMSAIQDQPSLNRSKDLRLLTKFPYCAETPSKYLSDLRFFYTPPRQMYERNHNLIPEIESKGYTIELMNGRTDEAEENAIELDFSKLKELG